MKTLLLAVFYSLSVVCLAQSTSVRGTITDETGQPLPGVNIVVKGLTQGTVSDADGSFILNEVPSNAVLIFSFIGYATKEVPVNGASTLTVQMEIDATSLDEVVVVGYGTSTVKELTGSVGSLRGENVMALNPVRVDQAMQGRIPGVLVTTNSGSPGSTLNIRIRGLSTYGDNTPLVIVDGIIYPAEGLNALNPSDIESIDVLKDASAAIYGVRGANGVIFITTKQGKRNSKPSFEFSGYVGIQETAKKLDLLNATEYAVLKNEMYAAGNQIPPFNNTNLGKGTDWQDKVFQTAPIQNWNMTLSGGSEKSNYAIGASYLDQEGIVGGDKASFRRYNARINFTTELAPRVTLQSILLYTHEQRKALPENGIGSVLYNTINASPATTVYTAGRYTYLDEVSDLINPLAQIANTFNLAKTNKIAGKEELTYKINNDFELAGRAGYSYALVDYKSFSPLVFYGTGKAQNTASNANLDPFMTEIAPGVSIPVENSVTEERTTYFDYNLEAFLNYNHTFGMHKVKATLGAAFSGAQSSSLSGTAFNVPYNSNNFADISVTDGNYLSNNTSSWQSQSRLLSHFIRGEYSYKEKYFASLILRRDGSARFGANNRFGFFPSASAGWVASQESFFQSSLIQFLKVRASYGVIGNDRIGDFRYRGLLNGEGVYPFNDQLVTGRAIGAASNPDLKWETTHQFNIGADVSLMNDKINITADYFIKTTKDLLFQPDVSALLGTYGAGGVPPIVNAGNVRNSGIELAISYNTRLAEDLKLTVDYNVTLIKNEVTKTAVDFVEGGAFGVGSGHVPSRMQPGYAIGYFIGFKTDGVYQTQEEIDSRGVTQPGAKPGDFRYKDLDGSGTINFGNDSDKKIIGSPIPDAVMGLSLGLQYKGFDFSVLVYTSLGNDILRNYERQAPLANQLSYQLNRWTGAGSTNSYPRLTTDLNTNAVLSDYFIEDGSFMRIRNMQLGYSLPTELLSKIKAKKMRVYVAANNLLTITGYRGFDPELSSAAPIGAGIDYGFYPQARTYMVGLSLNY
jgi:TonB-linked SusC/RagA family outer membrane protein